MIGLGMAARKPRKPKMIESNVAILPANYVPLEHTCKRMPATAQVYTARIGAFGSWGWWASDTYAFTCSVHDIKFCPWCGEELADPEAPRFKEKAQ